MGLVPKPRDGSLSQDSLTELSTTDVVVNVGLSVVERSQLVATISDMDTNKD